MKSFRRISLQTLSCKILLYISFNPPELRLSTTSDSSQICNFKAEPGVLSESAAHPPYLNADISVSMTQILGLVRETHEYGTSFGLCINPSLYAQPVIKPLEGEEVV